MPQLTVANFMTSPVVTVEEGTVLSQVLTLMADQRLSSVIVTRKGAPAGIITERSIVQLVSEQQCGASHYSFADPVECLMSSPLVTIQAEDSLSAATVLCRSQQIRHLPVLDGEALVGMVTYSNLVEANFTELERQAALLGEAGTDSEELNRRLLSMTLTDPLMEIGNRRAMEIDLQQTQGLADRYHRPYSIALFDIDFFKQYNDRYGHQAGDRVLKQVAELLVASTRDVDRQYRYGGEEILLLLPETSPSQASIICQRLVDAVRALGIEHKGSPMHCLTISGGIAGNDGSSPPEVWAAQIERADRALYNAKARGRNCVLPYEES